MDNALVCNDNEIGQMATGNWRIAECNRCFLLPCLNITVFAPLHEAQLAISIALK
jgi:hypothetical protein